MATIMLSCVKPWYYTHEQKSEPNIGSPSDLRHTTAKTLRSSRIRIHKYAEEPPTKYKPNMDSDYKSSRILTPS